MIDNQTKTRKLLLDMEAALPLTARPTPALVEMLRKQAPNVKLVHRCAVVEVFYMGDEGGICCRLGLDGTDDAEPVIVSITHLTFDRRCSLFRQIDAYQRHRIKKLKKQNERGY
jgi:hypothetical protein